EPNARNGTTSSSGTSSRRSATTISPKAGWFTSKAAFKRANGTIRKATSERLLKFERATWFFWAGLPERAAVALGGRRQDRALRRPEEVRSPTTIFRSEFEASLAERLLTSLK